MAASTAAAAVATALTVKDAFKTLSALVGLYSILNPKTACVKNNTEWDVIVIGAGTSGSVISSLLSEDDFKVLLIEAGKNFDTQAVYPSLLPYFSSDTDWNYKTVPDEKIGKCHDSNEFRLGVSKMIGGDSSSDFMMYTQGDDRDYNKWAEMTGEPAWSFPNVLKFFKKLERFEDKTTENSPDRKYHGFEGNLGLTKDNSAIAEKYMKAFEQIGKEIVRDINNENKTGVTRATFNIADGMRQNTALAYHLKNRTNVFVLKETEVVKILFDSGKRAEGVLAMTKDKRQFEFRAKEIIVTAGPINTAKLLQLSGIGDKKLLNSLNIPVQSDLPVGQNYRDHIGIPIVIGADKTNRPFIRENYDFRNFPVPSFRNYDSLNKSNPYPECMDVVYITKTTPPSMILTLTSNPVFQFNDDIVNGWFGALEGREVLFAYILFSKMYSEGEVRIQSTDPSDPPITDPRYLSAESDIENSIKCVKEYLKILDSPMMKKSEAFLVDPTNGMCGAVGTDEFWRCYVKCLFSPQNHHVGTAALGSVVDGRLNVKSVKGLRVADASVFPELMTGSMLGPTIMLGEMVAQMVKEDNNRNK